jgi:hypothetical protein
MGPRCGSCRFPVVAEGDAVVHRGGPFPADITDAFTAKYDRDLSAPRPPGEPRAPLEVPVRRRLPAGPPQ